MHSLDKMAQPLSSWNVEVYNIWEPTTSMGDYYNGWALQCENIYSPVQNQNLPMSNFFHYPLSLLWDYLWKRETLSSLESPLKYWNMMIKSPLSLLLSKLNKPSFLSFFSHVRFLSRLIIFVACIWTLYSLSAAFFA